MRIEDIFFIAEMETGCTLAEMIPAKMGLAYDVKCIVCLMAKEEEIKDKAPLAELLQVERNSVYNYINRAEALLSIWPGMPGYNQFFKLLYLACNTRRVYFEERPELTLTFN